MHLQHRIDTTFLVDLDETRLRHATVNHNDTYNYNPSGQGKRPGEGPDAIGAAISETAHEVDPESGTLTSTNEAGETTTYENGWDVQKALEGDGRAVNAGSIDAFTEGLDISDNAKREEINRQLKDQYGIAHADDQAVAGGIKPADAEDGKREGAEVLTDVSYSDGSSGVGFDVQNGDSITDLARRMLGHDPSEEELQKIIDANQEAGTIDDPDQIDVGQTLIVPDDLIGPSNVDASNLKQQMRGLDEFMAEQQVPTHLWDPNNSFESHLAHAKDPAFVQRALGEMRGGAEQERYKAFVESAYGGIDNVPDELKDSDVWKHQKPELREDFQPKDDRAPASNALPKVEGQPVLHVESEDGVLTADTGGDERVDTGARIKPPAEGGDTPVLEYWDTSGDRRTIDVKPGAPDGEGYYETSRGNKVRVRQHDDDKFWVEVKNENGKVTYTELQPPREAKAAEPNFGAHGSK